MPFDPEQIGNSCKNKLRLSNNFPTFFHLQMAVKAVQTQLATILPFRKQFLQELNAQFVSNAFHERGWTDCYLLSFDGQNIGYGAVKGQDLKSRDTIFEFYIVPSFRKYAAACFSEMLFASNASLIESQTNDCLLSSMLFEFTHNIRADRIIFRDYATTRHCLPDITFRLKNAEDSVAECAFGMEGDYVLMNNNEVVATGGFLVHYNTPFADLFMEVLGSHRGRGYGSFLLQELKKECYLHHRVPAARCNITNKISRSTLLKAGMKIAGYILIGEVQRPD